MAAEHLYLVPGFFGFANLGELRYFGHVHRFLDQRFERSGRRCTVHEVKTRPTASLHVRAATLADTILATAGPDDRIHLVGHSSGGLDARLLLANPTLGERDVASIVERTATVVTVSTPHHGTPSATTFGSLAGRPLLRLLSAMTIVVLRRGQIPLKLAMSMARLLREAERAIDREKGIVDEVYTALLAELTPERTEAVRGFFADVGADQALLLQITPEAMELFDATAPLPSGVRCGSVITRARRPGVRSVARIGLRPSAQASHALHFACHRMARWERDPVWLSPAQQAALAEVWPALEPGDNDGMVPTSSQPWGEVVCAVDADHLDVIGHFAGPDDQPPHYDWIRTGTGFRQVQFDQVWSDVLRFLA